MKRTKRLSIEVQHREVTITLLGSVMHAQVSEPDSLNLATVCPICGSPWIIFGARMDGEGSADVDCILRALERFGLHLQVSPVGQLQICRRSFEETKEKL